MGGSSITTGNIMKDPTEVVEVSRKPLEVGANIDAVRRAVFGRSITVSSAAIGW